MMIDTRHRSDAPELMDNFEMEGEILRDALDKIASINRLLGGNKVTIEGVQELLKGQPRSRKIHILDVGCGNGDMLRTLADLATQTGYQFQLTGVDANAFTIAHAQHLSTTYDNIHYQCRDIFIESEAAEQYDIILCTLTLHHFNDPDILRLLLQFSQQSRLGFVINDLERSPVAYRLFQALCFVFGLNDMSRDDGLVSILRGFKRKDLETFASQLTIKRSTIRWKWAFRYQWIVQTHG